MTEHESRLRAAAELARQHVLLLAGSGDWRTVVAKARHWYATHCVRWDRRETETRLVWVGTSAQHLGELQDRAGRPPSDRRYLNPEHAAAEFRRLVERHWAEEAETYRRHCDAVESYPWAEDTVERIVARVEERRAEALAAGAA